ncbi:MAG: sulfatase-like hydrolase/transferase, partial [Proteobacteria bacterium]|nr:sulfatase-like hydrolase/transferase [Pseudomonadota bacterium]
KPATEHHGNPTYAAMIESVDKSVGRVVKRLEKLGLTEKTVIVFTSDNGGHGRITSHYPLRGNKGNFYEGGIRVPLIVKWPGVVKPASKCTVPVISTDFYPTILAMAGLAPRPEQHLDGKNIVPLLKQDENIGRDALFWHYPNYIGAGHPGGARPCSVIRRGDWKLIESFEYNRLELYNLKDDLSEQEDLASSMPKKTQELHRMLKQWRAEAKVQMPKRNPDYDPK